MAKSACQMSFRVSERGSVVGSSGEKSDHTFREPVYLIYKERTALSSMDASAKRLATGCVGYGSMSVGERVCWGDFLAVIGWYSFVKLGRQGMTLYRFAKSEAGTCLAGPSANGFLPGRFSGALWASSTPLGNRLQRKASSIPYLLVSKHGGVGFKQLKGP